MSTSENKFFYEERPYIYAVVGLIALFFSKHSKLALISGLVLVLCAALILFLRKMHRSRMGKLKKKHDQFTGQKKKDSVKFEL